MVEYGYDAYGNCKIFKDTDNIATYNPYRYRGYYYDEETELYYLQTRYYDPRTGRFLNADSVEYADPETLNGLNLYAYCGNNPVMNVDPTGRAFFTALLIGLVVGAIIGGVIGGTVKGVEAYEDGARDWELAGEIIEGAAIGAVVGGVSGALIGAGGEMIMAGLPLIGGGAAMAIAGGGAAAAGTIAAGAGAVVVGGTVAGVGALISGLGITVLFAQTGKSNGYYGKKYSNDHKPDHIHLKGTDGTDIKIGRDGLPLKGQPSLNAQQSKALKKLWKQFLKLFGEI